MVRDPNATENLKIIGETVQKTVKWLHFLKVKFCIIILSLYYS